MALIQFDKIAAELKAFWQEIVVDNGPRYRQPSQWVHLWTDIWVSLFSCSYLLGHITAIAIPLILLRQLYVWATN